MISKIIGNQEKPVSGSDGYENTEISAIVNTYGAKNLNSYPYAETTKTVSNITFTDNRDGSVTVSAPSYPHTVSTAVVYQCHQDTNGVCELKNGDYKLSGCPSGGNRATGYSLRISVKTAGGSWTTLCYDEGDGADFTLNGDYYSNDSVRVDLAVVIRNSLVLTGPLTFKPMIRDARIQDPTWAPYAMTNRELTEVKVLSSQATFDSTYVGSSSTKSVIKCGRVVVLSCDMNIISAVPVATKLITGLPIPFGTVRTFCRNNAEVVVNSSGELASTNAMNTTGWTSLTVTYIAQ